MLTAHAEVATVGADHDVAELAGDGTLIAPSGTEERALAYQWMLFAMTEIEPPMIENYRFGDSPDIAGPATERCRAALGVVDRALDGRDHILGDRFSIADITVSEVVRTTGRVGIEVEGANLLAYLDRMEQRPARQRAAAAIVSPATSRPTR